MKVHFYLKSSAGVPVLAVEGGRDLFSPWATISLGKKSDPS